MLAKKAARGDKKIVTRNKEAKTGAIIDATLKLVGTMGYDRVTIRDIAGEAGVSIGLIYKYFPGGKFDIIIKGYGAQNIGQLLMPAQPEAIDYGDFPGYMRAIIRTYQQVTKDNKPLVKAMVASALSEGEVLQGIDNITEKDLAAIPQFFGRFGGVDITGKDPAALLVKWGLTIKSIISFNLLYPLPFMDDEALADLLVDLSLRIWGYKERP
jgi:AcrR family transcriptional regulator